MGRIISIAKSIKKYSALILVVAIFSGTSVAYASDDTQVVPSTAPSGTCTSPAVTIDNLNPVVTVSPCYNLTAQTKVTVDGKGFTPNHNASVIECNAAHQELAEIDGLPKYQVPVSCTSPLNNKAYRPGLDGNGNFKNLVTFQIVTGITGPPTVGDNYGTSTQEKTYVKEAKNYPCPPPDSQIPDGGYSSFSSDKTKIANADFCEITVGDDSSNQISTSAPIFFALTAPTDLRATPLSSGAVHLSWTSSTGGVTYDQSTNKLEPITYYIYRSGSSQVIRFTPALAKTSAYNYPGLKKGTPYVFYIIAHDYKGYTSPRSAAARS